MLDAQKFLQFQFLPYTEYSLYKPNPFEIVLLQTTRKENNWKTEETLESSCNVLIFYMLSTGQ